MGNDSEYMRNLILTMGVEARFSGDQQSGQLSIASPNGWIADKFPEATYISLPLSIGNWDLQKLNSSISPIDSPTYGIDITVPKLGPELLFISLQRFGNDLQ